MANKHRGSALISALFIMMLVSIATTAMMIRLRHDIQHVRLSITTDRLYLASQEVIFWGMSVLNETPIPQDSRRYIFPKTQKNNYPGILLSGKLLDLQGRFNLNQLIHQESDEQNQMHEAALYLLLNTVLEESRASQNRLIVAATKDWVNDKEKGEGVNAYQTYYQAQHPPYSASHQPMKTISEFRLVRGVDEQTYQKMLPYLTALPIPTPVNLNTASAPVIMTLAPNIDKNEVNQLLNRRGPDGFQDLTQINMFLSQHKIPVERVTLQSDYFLCIAYAKAGELEITHYAILKRGNQQDKRVTYVLQDSLNDY
jgi:general secretion pathway protein K